MFERLDIFGHTVLENTHALENGRIVLGGSTTRYDRDGKIVEKTEFSTLSLGFSDGPMTVREYREITER